MSRKFGIASVYAGIRFRSKLEVAWARSFDERGIRWEYEADSYNLDGVWYKPDFWLPDARAFFEVKGLLDDLDRQKLSALATIAHRQNITVALGRQPAGDAFQLVVPYDDTLCDAEHRDCPGFRLLKPFASTLVTCRCGVMRFQARFGWHCCPACGAEGQSVLTASRVGKEAA